MSAPALAVPSSETIIVPSRLFGPLRVARDALITFPDGLLAFGGERRFVLLPAAHQGVYWLQSADEAKLAFLLVDPFPIFADYAVELPDDPTGDPGEPPLVLAIVTLPAAKGLPATANLQGPVVIDPVRRVGRQILLLQSPWHTRHEFDLRARLGS